MTPNDCTLASQKNNANAHYVACLRLWPSEIVTIFAT